MSRAATCWKHPAHSQIGVCATCLRDRLKQLCLEEQYSSPRCSFDCTAAAAPAAPVGGLGENVAALLASDHHYQHRIVEDPLPKFATFLQRTHSWSGSRHQQGGNPKDLGKSKNPGLHSLPPSGALVCDEDFPTKGHYKASSWPEIGSPKPDKVGSWIASLFGFKKGKDQPRKKFFGLGRRKKHPSASAAASTTAGEDEFQQMPSASPWRFKGEFDEFRSSKVTPLGGEFSEPSLSKVRSVNGRKNAVKGEIHSSWSTPFRRAVNHGREAEAGESEVKRFHPSPASSFLATNSSYTAYFRDSWSLHSSPMPGKPRNHQMPPHLHQHQQNQNFVLQQQQARIRDQHHSPFHHATGSNTWNFYLTPLRPVRSSARRV